MGKHEEASKYYEKCLVIAEKLMGKDHFDYANSLNNIGSAF